MLNPQKSFTCSVKNCTLTFTNEDTLNLHEENHKINLHFGVENQSCNNDQTPTPTRFIRNCEEVGLFQDLQNVNPFDETFEKATELVKTGSLPVPYAPSEETLHTPHFFPHMNSNLSKETNSEDTSKPALDLSVISKKSNAENKDCKSSFCNESNQSTDFDSITVKERLKNALVSKKCVCVEICRKKRSNSISQVNSRECDKQEFSINNNQNSSKEKACDKNEEKMAKNKKGNGYMQRIREMNRIAQVRSRQKKKLWFSQLKEDMEKLKKQNQKLANENVSLKNEIELVKSILLLHKSCPLTSDPQIIKERDALINKYNEKNVKKGQASPSTRKLPSLRPSLERTNILKCSKSTHSVTSIANSLSSFALITPTASIPSNIISLTNVPVMLHFSSMQGSK